MTAAHGLGRRPVGLACLRAAAMNCHGQPSEPAGLVVFTQQVTAGWRVNQGGISCH